MAEELKNSNFTLNEDLKSTKINIIDLEIRNKKQQDELQNNIKVINNESENREIMCSDYQNQIEETKILLKDKNSQLDQLKSEFEKLNCKFDQEVDGIVNKYEKEVKVT